MCQQPPALGSDVDKIVCENCPLCDGAPRFIMSIKQAFCGNDDCRAVSWNMTITALENMEQANFLHFRTAPS